MRGWCISCCVVSAAFVILAIPQNANAVSFATDFNSGLPAGTATYGYAAVLANGGVGDSGVLRLTEALNNTFGTFVIDPLDVVPVQSFLATFQVRISDGTTVPADGMSFNFSNVVPNPPTYNNPGEEGLANGLVVSLDTLDNNFGIPPMEAPAIDVKFDGITLGHVLVNPFTGPRYVDMLVRMEADGTVDVTYDGNSIFSNLATGHVATAGGKFVIAARTGGLNSRHRIDNLSIETNPHPPNNGDYNGDLTVNAADYTIYRNTLGMLVTQSSGADGNNNSMIDFGDYTFWKMRYGEVVGGAGASQGARSMVPEPATLALAALTVVALPTYLRRRRRNTL